MSESTSPRGMGVLLCLVLAVFLFVCLVVPPTRGDESAEGSRGRAVPGKQAYVILSGEFFEAMEKLARSGIVTGDRQEQLLEQIAVAQRFTVRTNLALMEQNERIIRLLEEIRNQGGRAR